MRQYLLSPISYLLSPICGRYRDRSGFTMVEMVTVILILAILLSVLVTGLTRARLMAWRIQARESCRELCEAWNAYLLDERAFPEKSEFDDDANGIPATAKNIERLSGESEFTSKVYLELTAEEKDSNNELNGLRDHWGQPIFFMLDFDFAGEIENPYPAANGLDVGTKVRASVISWSLGDPKHDKRPDRKIVVW